MKKALLFLLSLLIALIVMVSCDNAVDYPFDDDVPAVETPEMVPLTFEFIKDGKIIITNKPDNMKFTRNSGAKQDVPANGVINAEGGDRIKLFATRTTKDDLNIICDIGDCYIYGNVMSLIKEDGFADKKDVFNYAFFNLFSGNTHIKNHSSKKLVLPATTLAQGCYNSMFEGCTGLTIAPDLPAEQLTQLCYFNMFAECSNLKTAPIISAKELAVNCCASMFRNCTSLSTAPVLLAEELEEYCYSGMFEGCTSLASAPDLKATTLANGCYQSMFEGCTSLTTAPELNATALVEKCYEYMFYGCSSLNYIKCLAINPNSNYTNSWVEGVAKGGLFIKDDTVTMENWTVGINGIPETWYCDPKFIPLTLEFIDDGTITISNLPTDPANKVYYTKNEGDLQAATISIGVEAGDKISFYATRTSIEANKYMNINCSSYCYIYGNVMSLISKESFATKDEVFDGAFESLFENNKNIHNHSFKKLVLPANTLADYCYCAMFANCINLTEAPELPATSLAECCYFFMFERCSSLVKAPKLPATTMVDDCYGYMFDHCISLTEAPELPATTLAKLCYVCMFINCENLKKAPELPATTLTDGCYAGIFNSCTSLESAPELPATELAEGCYRGMFRDCTNLTTAPLLPATTLAEYCYQYMFLNCTNLNNITCLATDISATKCTHDWLSGVSSSGTFTKASTMNDWTTGESGIPSGWTVQDYVAP